MKIVKKSIIKKERKKRMKNIKGVRKKILNIKKGWIK
jgi:hypothetical protein